MEELLAVSVSPSSVSLGQEVTVTMSAKDDSGVSTAIIYWKNPVNLSASIRCDNFVEGSCTTTKKIDMSSVVLRWGTSGDHIWERITLYDENAVTRGYNSDGKWSDQSGQGGGCI